MALKKKNSKRKLKNWKEIHNFKRKKSIENLLYALAEADANNEKEFENILKESNIDYSKLKGEILTNINWLKTK